VNENVDRTAAGGAPDNEFGYTIMAISGESVFIGAPYDSEGGVIFDLGAAYVSKLRWLCV